MFGKTTKRWFILNLNKGIFGYKEKEKASVLKGAYDLRVSRYEERTWSIYKKDLPLIQRKQTTGTTLACVSEIANSSSSRKIDTSFRCGCMASPPSALRCRSKTQFLRRPPLS